MKNGVVVMGVLMSCAHFASAQNWNEWTQQKKTQIAYLVNQEAALQVYIELGQKGYSVVRDGLTLIGDIKDGEFSLHNNYFASRSNVNPRVGKSPQVNEVLRWNEQVQLFARRMRALDLGNASTSLRRLFAALAQKSSDYSARIGLLVTDGNYQLKDEERMEQIDEVYREMLNLYGFAKQTYQDAVGQSKALPKQDKEMDIIERLQGIR